MKKPSDNQVSIEIAYENAANLLEKKEFDLAEQQLSEILKKFPNDPNALRLSGVSSLEQEKPEIALIPLQKAIKIAPEFIQAPTGTKININYSEEQPKIKIRIQELFGLKIHPTIGENKEPLLIELLSPAMRIVQTTSNLPKFWLTSYSDVRRDMRGRYPRHHWPENPMNSEPTKTAKKQK